MKLFNKRLRKYFTDIYENNLFNGVESVSGTGSDLYQTRVVQKKLPELFEKHKIKKFIDAPCGDFYWMQHVDFTYLEKYVGVDIVHDIVNKNKIRHADSKVSFQCKDICKDRLQKADIVMSRDCMNHLSYEDTYRAFKNFKRSGIKFLLITTFTNHQENNDLNDVIWRPLNFERPPFSFPKPIDLINEGCTEGDGAYSDKSLGLWEISKLDL
jgi:hypothetical protein